MGIVDNDRYVSALGQILDSLSHLHVKGVAYRDLKSENFLIEIDPLFKIVIADFGSAKVASDTTLLKTFYGSLKYAAPEVFPGLSSGHRPPVDVRSLGIIVFEWIYGIPNSPDVSKPKNENEEVSAQKLYNWVDAWAELLINKLEDQENDQVIQILVWMIKVKVRKRWPVGRCLAQGSKSGLFKRRLADGLVVCASDLDDLDLPVEEEDDGTKTPTVASAPGSEQSWFAALMSSAGGDPKTTIILGNMWGGEASANSH